MVFKGAQTFRFYVNLALVQYTMDYGVLILK